jgi:S-adenosylmethionine hydrolase
MRPIITLTTDFGLADPFVGIMKGVILSIAPRAEIVDITHEIAPQNVRQAAYVMEAAHAWFPKDAVHLVVVDPGVGGKRRPIAARAGAYYFVAPDNGVLGAILDRPDARVFELTDPRYFLRPVSATFHGRDVFSPVAAHIANGVKLSRLGRKIRDPETIRLPQPSVTRNGVNGEIVHIDRFGNLTTNIPEELLRRCFKNLAAARVKIGGKNAGVFYDSYSRCPKGETGCILNSWNRLEIFRREDNAARKLKCRIGDAVAVSGNRIKRCRE